MTIFRLLVLGTSFLLPIPAAMITLTGKLEPGQEVPPPVRVSSATGFAVVTLDDTANTLDVNVSWSNLNSNPVAGHIHCCAGFGVNAPVAINFGAGFPSTPSGTFSQIFNLLNSSSYGSAFLMANGNDVNTAKNTFIAGFLSFRTYVNIHTAPPSGYPAGEIRGQLVPEPSTWTLAVLCAGLVGVRAAWPRARGRR